MVYRDVHIQVTLGASTHFGAVKGKQKASKMTNFSEKFTLCKDWQKSRCFARDFDATKLTVKMLSLVSKKSVQKS